MRRNPVRKTILYAAVGALACVVAGVGWLLAAAAARPWWPSEGGGNLLWVIQGDTADGVGAKWMGVANLREAGATLLFIPRDTTVKGRSGELTELGDLGGGGRWGACCNAVSLLLGVPIDGYVIFSWDTAAGLCDDPGPISLDVPAAVSYRPCGDAEPVVIPRGRHDVTGAELLAYVAGASDKELTSERTERALRALLAAVRARVSAGGELRLPRSNLSSRSLTLVWESLVRQQARLEFAELPTTVAVRNGVARRVALAVEIQELVAASVQVKPLLTAAEVSVAVFNGSGARLGATKAAEYLQARGFQAAVAGNADAFTYADTLVVGLTDEAKTWILRDALPSAAKVVSAPDLGQHYAALRPKVPVGTDVMLVVGAGMEFDR